MFDNYPLKIVEYREPLKMTAGYPVKHRLTEDVIVPDPLAIKDTEAAIQALRATVRKRAFLADEDSHDRLVMSRLAATLTDVLASLNRVQPRPSAMGDVL